MIQRSVRATLFPKNSVIITDSRRADCAFPTRGHMALAITQCRREVASRLR
jgi:hypothetical protein